MKVAKPAQVKLYGTMNRPGKGNKKKRQRVALVSRTENMTEPRWKIVIEETANGKNRKQAAHAAGIARRTVDAYLISNVAANNQLREAQLLWIRREWPLEEIESVLDMVATGKTLKASMTECGIPENKAMALMRLLLKDAAMRKMYDEARELQAESFLDEIIDISDETENDFKENGKPNHELVNRSRLRVDTRKFQMGSMVKQRFGDHKHIDLKAQLNVNHAVVLSGGRKRLEQLHASRKNSMIDNATQEVINE